MLRSVLGWGHFREVIRWRLGLVFWCGVFCFGSGGGSFFQMGGGNVARGFERNRPTSLAEAEEQWKRKHGGGKKGGGGVYDIDLEMVNRSLVKALKLTLASRLLVGKGRDGYEDLMDIEREVREAAVECQRVLELVEADENRPLITS